MTDVIVRHLEHRTHRAFRVYYLDGIGRAVRACGGHDTRESAEECALRTKALFEHRDAREIPRTEIIQQVRDEL